MAELDLLYFGELREAMGRDGERVDPPSHVLTTEDLVRWLELRGAPYSAALFDRSRIRAAVDRQHAAPGDSFFGAQEVALFPPVTGDGAALSPGQRDGHPIMIDVRVQAGDFDPGQQLARLGELKAAAVASFVACATGAAEATAIVVEHYPAMAKPELSRIAEEAGSRWPLRGIILVHRHGRLSPGERLFFAAAAAASRSDALAACGFLAEEAGRRAPFWRREMLPGGGSRWAR